MALNAPGSDAPASVPAEDAKVTEARHALAEALCTRRIAINRKEGRSDDAPVSQGTFVGSISMQGCISVEDFEQHLSGVSDAFQMQQFTRDVLDVTRAIEANVASAAERVKGEVEETLQSPE